jgi:hypothetical protein
MTSINKQLGLRPAGKRAMMRLPADHARRSQVTAAICPACGERKAVLSRREPGAFACSRCWHTWRPE